MSLSLTCHTSTCGNMSCQIASTEAKAKSANELKATNNLKVCSDSSSDSGTEKLYSETWVPLRDVLHWLPSNHPGFELFPDGFPDLKKTFVKQVATKPLDFDRLRETQRKLHRYLPTQSVRDWWESTLTKLECQDKDVCLTCRKLRLQQMENCILRTDSDETKSMKSKLVRAADKELLRHLQDSESSEHRDYSRTVLFPPARFRWSNGVYEDLQKDIVELDDDGAKLVNTLTQQRQEQETHFVDMTKKSLSNRSLESTHSRPQKLEKGHIVVVRSDKPEIPFYVGEVVSPPRFDNDCDSDKLHSFDDCGDGEIEICEYGCENVLEELQRTDISNIKWRATFRGTEKKQGRMITHDEFRLQYDSKPSTKAMKPLVRTIFLSCIAEFDTPDRMLTRPSNKRTTAYRRLQDWVKTVLHHNPRVSWTRPTDSGKKRKRRNSPPDVRLNTKRSKKNSC